MMARLLSGANRSVDALRIIYEATLTRYNEHIQMSLINDVWMYMPRPTGWTMAKSCIIGIEPANKFNAGTVLATVIAADAARRVEFTKIEIIRCTDKAIEAKCDILLGCGGIYDAQLNRFDHNVVPTEDLRIDESPDGYDLPYGTAGLLWKECGGDMIQEILPRPDEISEEAYSDICWDTFSFIEQILFKAIDGEQNALQLGRKIYKEAENPDVGVMEVDKLNEMMKEHVNKFFTLFMGVQALNPIPTECSFAKPVSLTCTIEDLQDWGKCFVQAVTMMRRIFVPLIINTFAFQWKHYKRKVEGTTSPVDLRDLPKNQYGAPNMASITTPPKITEEEAKLRVEKWQQERDATNKAAVEKALQTRKDAGGAWPHPAILAIPEMDIDWEKWLREAKDEQTLYVIKQKNPGKWRVIAVKDENGQLKAPLPVAWANMKQGVQFAEAVGVPTAVFVRPQLDECGAKDDRGAWALAGLALKVHELNRINDAHTRHELETPAGTLKMDA